MDLIAMMLRDLDIPARDDYANIDQIPLFTGPQKEILRGMNGLRNRIVHRDTSTDERLDLVAIHESLEELPSLTQVCEAWLTTR